MAGSTFDATVALHGPLARSELTEIAERLIREIERLDAAVIGVDVTGLAADAVALDALCRVALAARRRGARTRLRNASAELLELIALAGLAATLAS
jgi:ABC-type transporter Mla MlaB component